MPSAVLESVRGDEGFDFLAAHASDWGNSLNQCRRGDKQNTMANMFVGGVVLMLDGILILFSL